MRHHTIVPEAGAAVTESLHRMRPQMRSSRGAGATGVTGAGRGDERSPSWGGAPDPVRVVALAGEIQEQAKVRANSDTTSQRASVRVMGACEQD